MRMTDTLGYFYLFMKVINKLKRAKQLIIVTFS